MLLLGVGPAKKKCVCVCLCFACSLHTQDLAPFVAQPPLCSPVCVVIWNVGNSVAAALSEWVHIGKAHPSGLATQQDS